MQHNIQVRSGKGTVTRDGHFTDVIEVVSRCVQYHSGWESITYKGKRYQLLGGIRTDWFINAANPIKGRNPFKFA
jgi:hypothetical protein